LTNKALLLEMVRAWLNLADRARASNDKSELWRKGAGMAPDSLPPACPECQSATKFRQALSVMRDMTQVLVYECKECNVLFFYRIEDGELRSWP
jgi:hypothetical protein